MSWLPLSSAIDFISFIVIIKVSELVLHCIRLGNLHAHILVPCHVIPVTAPHARFLLNEPVIVVPWCMFLNAHTTIVYLMMNNKENGPVVAPAIGKLSCVLTTLHTMMC